MNNDFRYMKFIYLHRGEETNIRDNCNLGLQSSHIDLPGSGVTDCKCETKVILGFIFEGRARLVLHKL